MLPFKTVEIVARDASGGVIQSREVPVQITPKGVFVAVVGEDLRRGLPAQLIDEPGSPEGQLRLVCPVFADLEAALQKALRSVLVPKITEEPVIRYIVESHVAFAVDDQGATLPNASFSPGAQWVTSPQYGWHHAAKPAPGGYGLKVGAKAMLKRTTGYGEHVQVEYVPYYRGGHHLGRENPAELLNAWKSFTLPEHAEEMPYSDEAALFFHRLLLNMVDMNRRVQDLMHDPDRLQALMHELQASQEILCA